MRLIIVSGLSGSGKSVALHVLEDLGYYCIDNLPAGLIKSVVDDVTSRDRDAVEQMAVGIDARNRREDLESLPGLIEELKQHNVNPELLFLQSSDDVLLKRYSESRRRHPLADKDTALRAAITNERDLLSPVVNAADLIIDTSMTSVYDLADTIRERIDRREPRALSVLIESFGFKSGIPADADFVFDMRCLPNPYWHPDLRGQTGQDKEVSDFLNAQEPFIRMFEDILRFLERWIPEYDSVHRSYLTVAIGCTGGQHRSVCMAEKLARTLRETHDPILIRHSGLGSHTISNL